MKSIAFSIAVLLVILLLSCGSKEERSEAFATVAPEMMVIAEKRANVKFLPSRHKDANANISEERYNSPQSEDIKSDAVSNKLPVDKKKIIKDGNISIKVNEIEESKKNIDKVLKQFNAYYEVEQLWNDDNRISYSLKIRIPSENFEKLVSSIENGKDEITNKSIQARDVTEEYIDLETCLINKREYLKRYKQLLSKAATVKDILAIEENIRALEEEIESSEGRLKYLSDQVAYSTLDINLFKNKEFIYKTQEQDKFSERIKTSLSNGWTSVVDFVLGIIAIWPVIILITGLMLGIRWFLKKRKRKLSN